MEEGREEENKESRFSEADMLRFAGSWLSHRLTGTANSMGNRLGGGVGGRVNKKNTEISGLEVGLEICVWTVHGTDVHGVTALMQEEKINKNARMQEEKINKNALIQETFKNKYALMHEKMKKNALMQEKININELMQEKINKNALMQEKQGHI